MFLRWRNLLLVYSLMYLNFGHWSAWLIDKLYSLAHRTTKKKSPESLSNKWIEKNGSKLQNLISRHIYYIFLWQDLQICQIQVLISKNVLSWPFSTNFKHTTLSTASWLSLPFSVLYWLAIALTIGFFLKKDFKIK